MAEFSKQYIQSSNSELENWDFDILEIAKTLKNGYYTPVICEGYGFIGIAKNEFGEIQLAFRKGKNEVDWKLYQEIVYNN